jgi:acyl-CoA dehydrogenase
MTPRGIARLSGIEAISAFLDAPHVALASSLANQAGPLMSALISPLSEPATDDATRAEARRLLSVMGSGGLLDSIGRADTRALCLTRETVAGINPLADVVLALQALVAAPLRLAGTDAQRERWLGRLQSGEVMAAFAMSEPEAGSDVAALQTAARRSGDGWVLDGAKHLISNAGIADLYLVFARTTADAGSRGISAFLVPAGTSGLRFVVPQLTAAGHPLGRIALERCQVGPDALLGTLDDGFRLGMMTLDLLRPTVGASACGMARRALVESLRHATSRRQFGEPLSEFPIIRDKIGRMATSLEAARLLVYRAAWQADHHEARITLEAAMAKSFATETAQEIIDEAVQIAGGPGVLLGHPVERLYRAVRALRIYEGTTEIQRQIVAGELLRER